jgi:hypothetical protein
MFSFRMAMPTRGVRGLGGPQADDRSDGQADGNRCFHALSTTMVTPLSRASSSLLRLRMTRFLSRSEHLLKRRQCPLQRRRNDASEVLYQTFLVHDLCTPTGFPDRNVATARKGGGEIVVIEHQDAGEHPDSRPEIGQGPRETGGRFLCGNVMSPCVTRMATRSSETPARLPRLQPAAAGTPGTAQSDFWLPETLPFPYNSPSARRH